MDEDIKVKSLYKALRILECFTVETPELGITELSEKLGLYKSNIHNILSTFLKMGYIEKNPNNGKYRLGVHILTLGQAVKANIGFRETIFPYMQKLSNELNEVVYLGIPSGREVVYLEASYPAQSNHFTIRPMLGIKAPMYCTGIGKAMMAYLPEEVIREYISDGLHRFTDNTLTDKEALVRELKLTKQRGYSIDNMEHELGIKCVGMPIFNRSGEVVAALSVSGPSLRVETRIEEIAQVLREHISDIQEKL